MYSVGCLRKIVVEVPCIRVVAGRAQNDLFALDISPKQYECRYISLLVGEVDRKPVPLIFDLTISGFFDISSINNLH